MQAAHALRLEVFASSAIRCYEEEPSTAGLESCVPLCPGIVELHLGEVSAVAHSFRCFVFGMSGLLFVLIRSDNIHIIHTCNVDRIQRRV